MATILEQLDSISFLANSRAWCLFRQRIEQPEAQRKLILIAVCVALLLDNMLYMVIVPIIPDYLRQIGAWSTHKEGGKIEYKQVTTANWQLTTPNSQSLIQIESINESLSSTTASNNNLSLPTKPPDKLADGEQDEESDDEYYYKTNKEEDFEIDKRTNAGEPGTDYELDEKASGPATDSAKGPTNNQAKVAGSKKNKTHFHVLAVRTGSHTVYEGEDSAIGILFASKAIVQLLVNPFSGAIIDRFGYDRPMMFGLTVLFVSTAVFACGRSYGILFFARSLQGVGSEYHLKCTPQRTK